MFASSIRAISAFLLISLAMIGGAAAPNGTAEEVRFSPAPGVVLAGTLERPQGTGPFPLAIFITGTGPATRGGFGSIRTRLLANGIATLTYDKRGLGKSTGEFVDTLPAMEADVAAAVTHLRTRPDIDDDRIALVGLSQGAAASPVVASRDTRIAAVVMLSGPVGRHRELFMDSMKGQLAAGGKSKADIDRITDATGKWMDARSRGAAPSEVRHLREATVEAFASGGFTPSQAEGAVKTLDTPVVLSMFEVGTQEALEKLRVPILLVYGSNDRIMAQQSIPAAETALSGNPDTMLVLIPGLGHGLDRIDAGHKASGQSGGDPMAPAVSQLVGDWLSSRLRHPLNSDQESPPPSER